MADRYRNDFTNQGVDAQGNTVFHPQHDPDHLGDMVVGQSSPLFKGPPVNYVAPGPQGSGLVLTVEQNPLDPPAAGHVPAPESRTLYIPNQPLFALSQYGTITAEIDFDLPMADSTGLVIPTGTNPLDYVWSLGVVLKAGDQIEKQGQQMIFTTCQFFSGGLIHFHGTDYKKEPLNADQLYEQQLISTKSYQDYAATQFHLSLVISRTSLNNIDVVKGTATLRVGQIQVTGNLKVSFPDINWASALGVSLVSGKNLLPSISVRLQKFTLSITP